METGGKRDPEREWLLLQARAQALKRCRDLLHECGLLLESVAPELPPTAPLTALEGLDERDLELIRLVCHPANWPYSYIAVRMHLTLPTVHRIRGKVFKRLGVRSRIDLVRRVMGDPAE